MSRSFREKDKERKRASRHTTTSTNASADTATLKEHRKGSSSQIGYTPFQLASMVGSKFTEIPDDVVIAALNLLKTTCDNQIAPYIGYFTPAEIHYGLATRGNATDSLVKACLPNEKFSVNIHPLTGHWVTSCYRPDQKEIHVYDSVRNQIHYEQILPQLRLVYGRGKMSNIVYKEVTQQGFDPLCGVMACAFAFTCVLGNRPENCSYDTLNAREHLRQCLLTGQVSQFPEKRSQQQQYETPFKTVKQSEKRQDNDKIRKQKSRENQNVREKERQEDKKRKAENRMNFIYRQKEREGETEAKKTKRTDDNFRQIEQQADTCRRQHKRARSPVRLKEQQADTCRRQYKRAQSPVRLKNSKQIHQEDVIREHSLLYD